MFTMEFTKLIIGASFYVYYIQGSPQPPLANSLEENDRYAGGENYDSKLMAANYFENAFPLEFPTNPLFYGFFYSFNVSNSLRLISDKFLAICYDTTPEFTNFLDKAMGDANVSDPFAFYSKPLDEETGRYDPYFHTTAKFCGRKDCLEYWNKAGKYLGKTFEMHLVGLFFTKRTYGVRVKLTLDEQRIFEMDERSNTFQVAEESGRNISTVGDSLTNDVDELHKYEGYFRSHKSIVEIHPLYPGIHFIPQPQDFHPTESRAHVTLGCAPNISAVQTGLDLLEIVDLEITGHVLHKDFSIGGTDTPTAVLRQYFGIEDEMEEVFVIYPTEKMVTQATFSVYL